MGRWLTVFTIILFFQNVFALNHQEEIKKAQVWADSFKTSYPILVFDRDEMNFLFASHGLFGEKQTQDRLRFLGEYVHKKIGLSLSRNELSSLDTYLSILTTSAVAQPILKQLGNPIGYKMCAVFANPPNGNARIESERMIGLDFKKVYTDESYERLSKKMSFEELYLFSLYHEVSHCLDPQFMPNSYQHSDDSHLIHLSEAFAETMAYLSLSKRIGADTAQARGLYRAVYSRKMGKYFANEDGGGGFFNPHRKSGGIIYYLTPYLLNSYRKIQLKEVAIDLDHPQEVLELALQIVKNNALKSREFMAIRFGLTDGFELTIKKYEVMAFNHPEFFHDAYLELIGYKSLTDLLLSQAFIEADESRNLPSLKLPSLPLSGFCTAVKSKNSSQFYKLLQDARGLMSKEEFSYTSLQRRYESLNSINTNLENDCFLEVAKH